MKSIVPIAAAAAGLFALSACSQTPAENAAENLEANAEMQAENLEAAAENAPTEAGESALENQAEATREAAENKAEDLTTNDADTNLANGI